MLCRRIIPCLDVADGRVVKGTRFVDLVDEGDPPELAERYAREGADELVFLDITAAPERRGTLLDIVERPRLVPGFCTDALRARRFCSSCPRWPV